MSEVYRRYLPPDPGGVPVAAPADLWQRAKDLIASSRARFFVLVAAPTTLAALYYGLLAAPQYVSHTEYIVRGVDAHRGAGLTALLNTFGVSRAADEISAIESFLKSREVLQRINGRVDLRAVYGAKSADWLARFPRFWEHDTFEDLFAYSKSYIEVIKDSSTGVTALDISAFDAASAKAIADVMLDSAADMANSLNARAEADVVASARHELEEARREVIGAQKDLTAYRDQTLLVDPLAFAGAMLQGIGTLTLDRSRTQAQIAETQKLSPDAPAIASLKANEAALSHKLEEERGKLAGDNGALATKVAGYERLTLLTELAGKHYASALVSLQTAVTDAERKRIYIEEVVKPNLPDEPIKPERLRNVASVFVVGFIAFSILWILSVGSKDHAQ